MFGGSMVALVTPMKDDGSLDLEALGRLVEYHVEQGTDGLVIGGTTGESPCIEPDRSSTSATLIGARWTGRSPSTLTSTPTRCAFWLVRKLVETLQCVCIWRSS